jgi:hypothetical protein
MICRLVTLAHYEDDLNVPTDPYFPIPLEKLVRAENGTASSSSSLASRPQDGLQSVRIPARETN